jgi:superfamily II RNA helicase
MEDYGYIELNAETEEYSLTPLGEIAAQIAETHPLVMAKCAKEWNMFADFSVYQIIGFLACFVDVKVPEEYRAETPKPKDAFLKFRITEMQSMFQRFDQDELDFRADTGINYDTMVQFDLIDEFIEWAKCEDELACKSFIQRLTNSDKAVSAGDFAKAGMKICALAKELDKAVELVEDRIELQHKLSQIDGLILKYITTTQSLYL